MAYILPDRGTIRAEDMIRVDVETPRTINNDANVNEGS